MEPINLRPELHLPDDEKKLELKNPPGQPPLSPAQPTAPQHKQINKLFLIAAGVILIALIIASVAALFFAQPKVILQNVPASARAIWDGQKTSETIISARPGIHYLKIAQPGYITLNKQIKLKYFERYRQNAHLRPVPNARQIATQEIFSLSRDKKNAVYYLDGSAHIIYQIEIQPDGKTIKTALTPQLDHEIEKVIFSPDFALAILKLKNGETGEYDFNRYDLLHQEYTPWGDNIGEALWRQDGKKVLYWRKLKSGKKMLTLANRNNSERQNLIFLDEYGINDPPLLDWTNDQKTVLMVAGGNLYLFDIDSKSSPTLVVKDNVSQAKFTPDNGKIIFTQNGNLKIMKFKRSDSLGQPIKDIGKFSIESIRDLKVKASAQKTAISADSQRLIVFEPKRGLLEVNLESGKIKKFNYENKAQINIESLQISADEKTLFFLTQDKKLMKLKLDKGEY